MHLFYSTGGLHFGMHDGVVSESAKGNVKRDVDRMIELDAMSEDLILVLTGGEDVDPTGSVDAPTVYPRVYVERNKWSSCNAQRDYHEQHLLYEAVKNGIPVFAFCRGSQLLGMSMGGQLTQDVGKDVRTKGNGHTTYHPIELHGLYAESFREMMQATSPFQRFTGALNTEEIWVNSYHHQGVLVPGPTAELLATHPDGLPEAIIYAKELAMGVQWHPEYESHIAIVQWFAQMCGIDTSEDPECQSSWQNNVLTLE